MTIPNLRQALEENFLDSDSGYEDCTSDSVDGSENILEKSCNEAVRRTCRTRISPLDGTNVLRAKKALNDEKIS